MGQTQSNIHIIIPEAVQPREILRNDENRLLGKQEYDFMEKKNYNLRFKYRSVLLIVFNPAEKGLAGPDGP